MVVVVLRRIVVAAIAAMVMVASAVVATFRLGGADQADGKEQGETQCIADFHGFGGICCFHKPNNAGIAQAMTQGLVAIVSNCFGALMRQCRSAEACAAA